MMNNMQDLELPTIRIDCKPEPGIYFLWLGNALQYIGKTTNLYKRIGGHYKEKVFDSYSFVPCTIDELIALEIAYIRKYNPPLNVIYAYSTETIDLSKHANIINNMRKERVIPSVEQLDKIRNKIGDSPLSDFYWSNRLKVSQEEVRTARMVYAALEKPSKLSPWGYTLPNYQA